MVDISGTDEELMSKIAGDHRGAFDELARRWRPKIVSHCRLLVGDIHLAEDLTQEVLTRLWRYRTHFAGNSKFTTYIWRIVSNACSDGMKRRKRDAHQTLDDEQTLSLDPDEPLAVREEKMKVKRCIEQLSENQRVVLLLRHYEGLRFREIAEILSIPEGTVCSRMADALKRMGQLLNQVD